MLGFVTVITNEADIIALLLCPAKWKGYEQINGSTRILPVSNGIVMVTETVSGTGR